MKCSILCKLLPALIFVLIYCPLELIAQPGFFNLYPLDVVGTGFLSIQQHEDQIYVYATSLDTSVATNWKIHLLKFDTIGEVINQMYYADPLGAHAAINGIIQGGLFTMNDAGEMACTGGFLGPGRSTFVFKADTSLSWYQLYELSDSSINSNIAYQISSYDGGYLVSGTRSVFGQTGNHKFIMKFSSNLENILNKQFVLNGSSSVFASAYLENSKLYAGSRLGYTSQNAQSTIRHSEFYKFDENGEILNMWQSDIGEEEGIQYFVLAPGEGFLYSTMEVEYLPDNLFSFYPRLVRRDSTYQKLWEVELPVSGSDQNRVMGITRSLDGHWLVTAKLYTELAGSPGSPRMAPCVFKISDDGEILWNTCVTFPYSWVNNQYPSFRVGNVIQISTGSMYVVGSVNRSNPSRTLGWMLKLDKDGCLYENPCHPPPDTAVSVSNPNLLSANKEGKLDIHPNPTSSTATVQIPGPGRLALYDLQGRLLKQESIPAYQLDSPTAHELQINTNTLPAGMYMLVFYGDDGFVFRGKLGVVP